MEVWEGQERNEKLQLLVQVQYQDLSWKLDRQIESFPVEYKVGGASPDLIEAEVCVINNKLTKGSSSNVASTYGRVSSGRVITSSSPIDSTVSTARCLFFSSKMWAT